MRTSEELYHQVRWDPRFDPARFVLGLLQRGAAPKRVALPSFVPGGDVPWHRVLFVEADGELVWDRATGVDRVESSGAGRARAPRLLRAPFFTARTAHSWDPARGWVPAVDDARPGRPAHAVPTTAATAAVVRVLTWNTLWDRYDGPLIETARRRPLLLAGLAAADADVIALQEVERPLLDLILAEPWVRSSYTVGTSPGGRDVADTGLLLLSRLPVREAGVHALGPHKGVTALTVETAAGPLVVAATHLSSDHSADGAGRRTAELARLTDGLAGIDGEVVLMGDFNDGRGGAGGPAAVLGLRDAWADVHGEGDTTPTFDPAVNPLAAVGSLTGRAARLDRILLRGRARVARAALIGDRPATADGLFVSDHFGVEAELDLGAPGTAAALSDVPEAADGPDALDLAPTARTAVAWIPPGEWWPAVQELRRNLDPRVDRWPPHVNLLFGFVPESVFERAAELLAGAAAEVPAFTARPGGVHTFGHREDATLWLDPAADGEAPWQELRAALVRRFPGCRGRADGFTPHLTLGRSTDPERAAARCAAALAGAPEAMEPAPVGSLAVLSRRGGEPMRVRFTVALGTGEVRWLPEAREEGTPGPPDGDLDDLARSVTGRLARALPEGVVEVAGSRRMGCALPGADLDLVAALAGPVDPARLRERVVAALPEAVRVREVRGARVPGLRLRVGALDVDLAVVASAGVDPGQAVARRTELGGGAALALSAVSDAEAVRAAVAPERRAAFAELARRVKEWARARGLDSAPFGGLPGLAWSVLAARTVGGAGAAELSHDALLREFFGHWAAWDWRLPVALWDGEDALRAGEAPVTVLTPSAPVRTCTAQVGAGFRDLLVRELYRGWEITGSGVGPWPALLGPPPLHRRHAAWAQVTVRAERAPRAGAAPGRVRGRMRALLTALEEAGAVDAHAWPRPFAAEPGSTRYAIGLGAAPPDAARLAVIAGRWAAGLPGVEVSWVAGGDVPSPAP
ncbi:RNA repair domain-containing protein [Streptomyces sp. NBC_00536]|uniref:poly(A) polymerase n=1 Tax=Streptomyces sp. NBC_00536 TaxID=2975769 RepID=UPI002E8085AC|nr:poly(A) polymerase [Streptomyces sp. NBC_00536]WUC77232.1 RNA repair domain-containing protein [Streptomyces sp. NBC_00536]